MLGQNDKKMENKQLCSLYQNLEGQIIKIIIHEAK